MPVSGRTLAVLRRNLSKRWRSALSSVPPTLHARANRKRRSRCAVSVGSASSWPYMCSRAESCSRCSAVRAESMVSSELTWVRVGVGVGGRGWG